jgi:hypothetical protein
MSKRQFPYYSAVPELEIKRRDFGNTVGTEREINPNIYEAGQGFGDRREVASLSVTVRLDHIAKAISYIPLLLRYSNT